MLITVKTILFVFILVALTVLGLCIFKLRRLIAWRFSNAYTQEDMAYFHEVLLDVKSTDCPYEFMRRHIVYRTYKFLLWFVFIISVCLLILSVSFDLSLKSARVPSQERIELAQQVIELLYCTHPNDLQTVWEEELKDKIAGEVAYKLNTTLIENLTQRHRLLSSPLTTIQFKHWYITDNNEILLWYQINSPSVTETRQMQFLFDDLGKIVQVHEYKEPEPAVIYLLGES